mgnify:FL=1
MNTVSSDTRTTVRDRHDVDAEQLPDPMSVETQTLPEAERKGKIEQISLFAFIALPFLALLTAVPFAWGWGLGWHDMVIAVVAYCVAGHGVTVGFHR